MSQRENSSWRRSLAKKKKKRTRRKHHPRTMESLEDRHLLANLADVARELADVNITGATIVTHGFQLKDTDGDSLLSLASAVRDRADAENGDESAWLIDYDVPGAAQVGEFNPILPASPQSGDAGHVVLTFDWAPESNEFSAGWTPAASDALFSMIVGLGLVDPEAGTSVPLHFIAHSFGAAVNGGTVERLAQYGVEVDHVTYLDPHDFNQTGYFTVSGTWVPFDLPVDGAQQQSVTGMPQPANVGADVGLNYGASVWNNVVFADAYYQVRGTNFLAASTGEVPRGRPIPGAYNVFLDAADLPDDCFTCVPYELDELGGDHSFVWTDFYVDTIEANATAPSTPTGYEFSRVAKGEAKRESPVFYGADQDHTYSSPLIVDAATGQAPATFPGTLTESQITLGQWSPTWDSHSIVNGDFEAAGNGTIIPGWSHHGGGGSGEIVTDGGSSRLELVINDDPDESLRTHNLLYVPEAVGLLMDLEAVAATDTQAMLDVQLSGITIAQIDLSAFVGTSPTDPPLLVPIHADLLGQSHTLSFRIRSTDQADVGARALIDNVAFTPFVNPPTREITGQIFSDVDRNGVWSRDLEESILGQTFEVYLDLNGNGQFDDERGDGGWHDDDGDQRYDVGEGEVKQVVTDGWFRFVDVPLGDYWVRQESSSGWEQTGPQGILASDTATNELRLSVLNTDGSAARKSGIDLVSAGLTSPQHVTGSRNSPFVYVNDDGSGIRRFDAQTGNPVDENGQVVADSQFIVPSAGVFVGLATDVDGVSGQELIYVVEQDGPNATIKRFDTLGNEDTDYSHSISSEISDLAVLDGQAYVIDKDLNSVGTPVRGVIQQLGFNQPSDPQHIAIDAAGGSLYVVEGTTSIVHRYDLSNGRWRSANFQTQLPARGLTADHDRIFVAVDDGAGMAAIEQYHLDNSLGVFVYDGNVTETLSTPLDLGRIPGVSYPLSITGNDLHVVDFGNARNAAVAPSEVPAMFERVGEMLQDLFGSVESSVQEVPGFEDGVPFLDEPFTDIVDVAGTLVDLADRLVEKPTATFALAAPNYDLTGDSQFVFSNDETPPTLVSIPDNNRNNPDDLADDFNDALADAGLTDTITVSANPEGWLEFAPSDDEGPASFSISSLQGCTDVVPTYGQLPDNTTLTFTITRGDEEREVEIVADTSDNAFLPDLVEDLNEELSKQGVSDIKLFADGDKLVINGVSPEVTKIAMTGGVAVGLGDITADSFSLGGIGLDTLRGLGDLKFDSVDGLVAILETELRALAGNTLPVDFELDPVFDPATDVLEFNFALNKDYVQTVGLDFANGFDLGLLGSVAMASISDASLTVNADVNFRMGIYVGDLGLDFVFDAATLLLTLNDFSGVDILTGITADRAAPVDGQIGQDITFAIEFEKANPLFAGTHVLTLEHSPLDLSAPATNDNFNVASLVSDLNRLLTAEGLDSDLAFEKFTDDVGDERIQLVAKKSSGITSLTITDADALGFGISQDSHFADLAFLLGLDPETETIEDLDTNCGDNHCYFNVSLDGATTVQDVIDRIEAAGPVTVSFNDDGNGFSVSAASDVIVEQAETDGHRSLAGLGLGILGTFTAESLDGPALHGQSLLDRVYVVPSSTGNNIQLTANVHADIDASAAIGKLGFDLVTETPIDITMSAGAGFRDTDGDGLLYLSEAFAATEPVLDLTGLVPTIAAAGELQLRTTAGEQTNIFGETTIDSTESLFSLEVTADTANGDPFQVIANAEMQGLASQFKEICVGDVIQVLTSLAESLKANATLNVELPGIGLSPLEMLEFADVLLDVAAEFVIDIDIPALELAIDALNVSINNMPLRPELLEIGQLLATLPSLDVGTLNSNLVAHLRLLERHILDIEVGTIGLPELQLAFDELSALIPSWGTFEARLEAALELALETRLRLEPGDFNFQLGFIDDFNGATIDLPESPERAIVLGFEFDQADLISQHVEPVLPSSELGPIELVLDAELELQAGAKVSVGFGVTLDESVTPFIITEADGSDEDLVATEVVFNALLDGEIEGDVKIGSLDLLAASGTLKLAAAEVEELVVSGNQVELSAAPIQGDGDLVLVFVNGSRLNVDEFDLNGTTLSLPGLDGTTVEVHYQTDAALEPATFTVSLESDGTTFANSIGATELADIVLDVQPRGMVSGKLSAEFLGNSADVFSLAAAIEDPLEPQFVVNETALHDLFANIDFDIKSIIDAFDALLSVLEDGIADDVLSSLPIVGDGFNPDETFIGDLRTFVDELETTICEVDGNLEEVGLQIRGEIIRLLGSAGLNILKNEADVRVDLSTDNLEIEFEIGGEENLYFDFDIGIDSLPLEVSGQGGVELQLGYGLNFVVGTDREQGIYFGAEDNTHQQIINGNGGGTEASFDVSAHLIVEDGIPTSISADLFGLEVSVTDNLRSGGQSGTYIEGGISLDLADTNGTGRVYVSDLFSTPFGELFTPTLANVDSAVDLQLAAGLGTTLPQVQADLTAGLNVGFSIEDGRIKPEISLEGFGFEDVGIDLGDFLSKHAGVILDRVNAFIEPIREPIEMLTQEIPGVSDLSKAAGNGKVTFLDVAFADNPDLAEAAEKFLDTLVAIVELTDTLETLEDDNVLFVLMEDASLSETNGNATLAAAGVKHDPSTEKAGPLKSLLQQIEDVGINLYMLSEPTNVVNMLLGQPFDVASFDIPRFELPLELSQKFPVIPIPPISVRVGFEAGFTADLSVGYDSHGIDTGNFFDGFYFGDRAEVFTGKDITEFELSISASLAALLDAGLASAGVEGKLKANVEANWRDLDDDGKMHLDEIESILQTDGIECIFDLSGSLNAIISVVWEVLGGDGSKEIANIELFDFSNKCPTFELGHVSDGGESLPGLPSDRNTSTPGTLILHAGSFADLRGPGKTSDTTEEFTVTELAPGVIQVEGLGLDSRYADVSSIYFDGGKGDDKLITVNVNVPVVAVGGIGADVLYGGSVADYLDGGDGKDLLYGSNSVGNELTVDPNQDGDTIFGGDDDDVIWGYAGADTLNGNDGDDTIYGGDWGDTIDGGNGNDLLIAGNQGETDDDGSADIINGGLGHDVIWGFGGADILDGGGDNDFISGGDDADTINGGPGSDVVLGDAGNDIDITGGSDDDFVSGGYGDDLIRGESGNDLLVGDLPFASILQETLIVDTFSLAAEYLVENYDHGSGVAGNDTIEAGTGNDLLIGDVGADRQFGGWGNDAIVGHLINDQNSLHSEYIEGGPDDDFICGAHLDDEIYGGSAAEGYAKLASARGLESGGFSFTSDITSCENLTATFELPLILLDARIDGHIFDDVNGDGNQDADEDYLAGWTVYLYDEYDQLAAETTTDNAGYYAFENLPHATYAVSQAATKGGRPALPSGYSQTYPTFGNGHTTAYSFLGNATGLDFGNHFSPMEVYGQKYHDVNGNGMLDVGETGLNGWEIQLLDEEGRVLDSQITAEHVLVDENGFEYTVQGWYEFEEVAPGDYWVSEVAEPNWIQSEPALADADDTFRLLADDGYTATESVAYVFGMNGTITDINVTLDLNHEKLEQLDVYLLSPAGTRVDLFSNVDATVSDVSMTFVAELGLPVESADPFLTTLLPETTLTELIGEDPNGTWKLYVQDEVRGTQGQLDFWDVTLVTDSEVRTAAGGAPNLYAPEALRSYRIGPDTAPARPTPFPAAGGTESLNFGNFQPGEITGSKFLDEDGDGIGVKNLEGDLDNDGRVTFSDFLKLSGNFGKPDPNGDLGDIDGDGRVGFGDFLKLAGNFGKQAATDPVLPGVTIYADYNHNGILDTSEPSTVTGPNGEYTLSPLAPGLYDIREVVPPGFSPTVPDNGVYENVVIDSGTTLAEYDFANKPDGGIHGNKFEDLNGNGQRDVGEPGLAGVGIYIDANDNGKLDLGERTAITMEDDPQTVRDETGEYWIENLEPGSYVVREVVPQGFEQTTAGELVVYETDFEGSVGDEWSDATVSVTPRSNDHILGLFENESVRLTVENLPEHERIQVSFDLIIAGTWEGNHPLLGDDAWSGSLDGVPFVRSTFSNTRLTSPTWHNPINPYDVNNDRVVDRNDADAIRSELQSGGNRQLGRPRFSPFLPEVEDEVILFVDANADGQVTELDLDLVEAYVQANGSVQVNRSPQATRRLFGQSYPASADENFSFEPGQGSQTRNSLGYGTFDPGDLPTPDLVTPDGLTGTPADSVYRLSYTLPHSDSTARIDFTGMGLENIAGMEFEQWGIDNVAVSVPQDYHLVDLSLGATVTDVDFGNARDGEIRGIKWLDANGDAEFNNGERGLPGVTIYIDLNKNGTLDDGEPNTVTSEDIPSTPIDESGSYRFKNVPPGTYWVSEIVPESMGNFIPTNPSDGVHEIELESGELRDFLYFGNRQLADEKMEFGDAPNSYQTTFGSDGPRHAEATTLFLGSAIDFEFDGRPSFDALEDDETPMSGPDDEDGVAFGLAPMAPATPFNFDVTVSGSSGFLNVWVDFDGDGTFSQTFEHVIVDATPAAATSRFGFTPPSSNQLPGGRLPEETYMRVRYSTEPGLAWFGPAKDGEVEDYRLEPSQQPGGDPQGRDPQGGQGDRGQVGGGQIGGGQVARTLTRDSVLDLGSDSDDYLLTANVSHLAAAETGGTTGTVEGVKWFDRSRNGRRGNDEPGLAGVTIYADLNNDGQRNAGEPFAVTLEDVPTTAEDETGRYKLELVEGKHIIREIVPLGYRQTFPNTPTNYHEVDVVADEVHATSLDFGNACDATVSGFKWLDQDGNGVKTTEEMGLGGVEIYADLNGNGQWDPGEPITTTDATGSYSLCVPSGVNFFLSENVPNGYVQTSPQEDRYQLNLEPNQQRNGVNFGNRSTNPESLGEIFGRKWHDDNRNRIMDGNERGLKQILIYLDLNNSADWDGGEPLAITSADNPATPQDDAGFYRFEDVPPGEYTIRELIGGQYEQTFPISGEHQATLGPGQSIGSFDFGNRLKDSGIEGVKWNDLNNNGLRDAGEPGLPGIVIYIDENQNGRRDAGEQSTVTQSDNPNTDVDETGRFELAGPNAITKLPPGTYHVREYLANASGYLPTFPNAEGLHEIELLPGETEYLEFGNHKPDDILPGEIHGLKWIDTDGDGQRDANEPGLAGVRIFIDANDDGVRNAGERRVLTSADDPTTSVDETGMYWFTNLTPGTYRLCEDVPAGYEQTFPAIGYHDVTLGSGEIKQDILFGNHPTDGNGGDDTGEIHGTKWADFDGDGVRDKGEPGWAGVTIYLDANQNGQLDVGESSTVTMQDDPLTRGIDETGMYWFTELEEGSHYIREIAPNGSFQTWPAEAVNYRYSVDLIGNVLTDLDFGNQPDPTVTGNKWNDLDGDGIQDPDEPPMGDVRIYADLDGDGEWDQNEPSTLTNGNGEYELGDLPIGEYTIREVQRGGFIQTYPGDGHSIDVFPQLEFHELDFGNHEGPGGTIRGTKFDDNSGQLGSWDGNDTHWGASGYDPVTIYLDQDGNGQLDAGELSVQTDSNGEYEFTGLATGIYTIREVLPKGFAVSYPHDGFHEIIVEAGRIEVGLDFGNFEFHSVEDGDDVIFAGDGADQVWGDNLIADPRVLSEGTRQDEIHGEGGADELYGQEADDNIWGDKAYGSAADDILDGGDGKDRVWQTVNASSQVLTNGQLTGQGTDTLFAESIEHATLTGGTGGNTIDASGFLLGSVELFGREGNDTLLATEFDDLLAGDEGSDDLQGGEGDDKYHFATTTQSETDEISESSAAAGGVDTLDFAGLDSNDPLTLDLVAGTGSHTNRTLNFVNPQFIENVNGGDGDDVIRGSITENVLRGGPGNDELDGDQGNDWLIGGLDRDTLSGGADDDTFLFETEPDVGETISDVSGVDTLDLASLPNSWLIDVESLELSISDYSLVDEVVQLGAVTFTTSNTLERIVTGAGNELVRFTADLADGDGELQVGAGIDTLDYAGYSTGVQVNLAAQIATGTNAVVGFENIYGSPQADDLSGDQFNNELRDNGGGDTLTGFAGDDLYLLTQSPDGTAATPSIVELSGDGIDTLDVSAVASGMTIDMNLSSHVENIIATPFADTIIPNADTQTIEGREGDDTYRFSEFAGDITIVEPSGSDGGSDWFDFGSYTSDVSIDIAQPTNTIANVVGDLIIEILDTAGQSATSIENVVGGRGNDTLYGNDRDNELRGGAGGDELHGRRGRDVLNGGAGTNELFGGADDDTYIFNDLTRSFSSDTTLHEDDAIVGGGFLAVGGRDTLDFSSVTDVVNFDLNVETNTVGVHTIHLHNSPTYDRTGAQTNASVASPENFEILIGSIVSANILQGNAADNLLVGGDAVDELQGRGGADIMVGYGGGDLLTGGSERDFLVGGLGADELRGGVGEDILIGGYTVYDPPLNRRALELLSARWIEDDPFADRIEDLLNVGVEDGGNSYRLAPLETVLNDLAADILSGGEDLDWYFGEAAEVADLETDEQLSP